MADKDLKFSEAPSPRARHAATAPEAPVEETPEAPAAQTAAEAFAGVDAVHVPASADQLSSEAEIAARTAPDAPVGTKFRKTFVVSRKWHTEGVSDDSDMHRANCVATLQEALNRGLHPKGEAAYVGDDTLHDGSEALHYEVEVVLATEDADPAGTYTPSFSLEDMGGSTVQAN